MALQAEIAELKAKLARAQGASGQYTPAPATVQHSGPLKQYLVSLDHIHKGLVTPSPYFARQATEIVPGRAAEGIRRAGADELSRANNEWHREAIRRRIEAQAQETEAAEQAMIRRGRPIEAVSEADAKAQFFALHGIEGWSGQGPEARELTPEELATGEWGPPPQPHERFRQRSAEKPRPQRQQPTGPTAARDAALTDALAF